MTSPSQITTACPRHSPDSGIALSTDSSYSPQTIVEKKRSNSLTQLTPTGDKVETDQRPNSASAVLSKAISSSSTVVSSSVSQHRPYSSSGTVPLNHNPTKAISHFTQPPSFGQLPYNSSYYPGYTSYNSYGVSPSLPPSAQPAVYPSPYSGYSSTPSAGSHYYPHSGPPGSNLYAASPRYPSYLPQRNASASYMSTLSYYPPQTSSSAPLPFSDFPSTSATASTSSAVTTEPPAYVHSSPAKPLSSSQSLPDDEAHMSPDSSAQPMDGFPVVSLPAAADRLNHSPHSEVGEQENSPDKEESGRNEQEEDGMLTRR